MTIRAVVFDLGGVLETDVDTDMYVKWEGRLNLKAGELRERYFSTGWLLDATFGKMTEEEMLCTFGMHAILFQNTTQAIAAVEACLQAHTS